MSYRSLRRFISLAAVFNKKILHHKRNLTRNTKLLIGINVLLISNNQSTNKQSLEDNLASALKQGHNDVIKLMDDLKELVMTASREYRACLSKQIDITRRASEIGPLSDVWDQLPHYRNIAEQLNAELNEYITVFKIIGEITYDQSLITALVGDTEENTSGNYQTVTKKYKELEILIFSEFEENKKKEIELLKLTRDSILKS